MMTRHGAYWKGQIQKGNALVIGPAAGPKGFFGIGVIRLEDPAQVDHLLANDPAILANIGFRTEAYPMPSILLPEGA